MSRSPHASGDQQLLAGYRDAWQATMQMLRQGRSFSGNEANCVFLNTQQNDFIDASAVTGLNFTDDGRAIGVTDWDQDGDLDLWLRNRTGPRLRLMINGTRNADSSTDDSTTNFVSFRLQGTQSNRDGIGARVELHLESRDASPPLVATVRAGDAFLSQSSKWVHFGIGPAQAIRRVVVHWPGGEPETFTDILVNRRQRLVQGRGEASVLAERDRPDGIEFAAQEVTTGTSRTRIRPASPFPLPQLPYESAERESQGIESIVSTGQPRLILIWASWCPICQQELAALGQRENAIRDAGLDVLALSVDRCDVSEQQASGDRAAELIARIKFPFPHGFATNDLLVKLQLLQGLLCNREQDFVVPAAYLLDERGDLVSFYRGQVDVHELIADVRGMDSPSSDTRDLATPFAGRWTDPAKILLPRRIGNVFRDAGFDEDYRHYLELDRQLLEKLAQQSTSEEQRQQLANQYSRESFHLGMLMLADNQREEAEQLFKNAINADPKNARARVNVGILLARRGNQEAALEQFLQATEAAPTLDVARVNLAQALIRQGQYRAAEPHVRFLLERNYRQPGFDAMVARLLLELGEIESAVPHYQRAIEAQPRDFAAALQLAWILATAANDELRDGSKAVRIADEIVKLTKAKDLRALDVQAAAHAEAGDIERASTILDNVIRQLNTRQQALKPLLQKRLESYKNGRPYRDPDSKYP